MKAVVCHETKLEVADVPDPVPGPGQVLLEVVRGDKTAPDVLLTAMALGKRIRKVPVVAGV